MTVEEKETYQAYKKILADICHWTEFKENLSAPKNGTPEELAAYRQLLPALDDKITNLTYEQHLFQEKIDALEARLENTDIQKQIQLITHDMLLANTQIRKDLAKAAQNIEVTMRALAQGLFAETHAENQQDTYTTRQLYDIVRKRFYGCKKEVGRRKKVICKMIGQNWSRKSQPFKGCRSHLLMIRMPMRSIRIASVHLMNEMTR